VTAASGLFEPKKTGSIPVKWLPQAHSWATLSSAKMAPGRPQAKASGHRFRFFFAIRRPKPPVSSSSMSRRAYEQFMGLETEMRESGTTYSCPQGNTKILAYHEPCLRGRHAIRIWAGGSTPLCPRAGRVSLYMSIFHHCAGVSSANRSSLARFWPGFEYFFEGMKSNKSSHCPSRPPLFPLGRERQLNQPPQRL
jgi:hypothetical protein